MSTQKNITIHKNIEIPMRDEVILRADHIQPDADGPLPALIVRTPYLKESFYSEKVYDVIGTAQKGYHILLCDVRGGGQSDGEFAPFVNERADGFDTIQWAASQPWCDGNVGTFGYSYNGDQQILAASQNPPALKAIAPGGASNEYLPTFMYGVLSLRTSLFWYMKQLRNALVSGKGDFTASERKAKLAEVESIMRFKNETECRHLPMLDAEVLKIEGIPVRKFFNEWVDNCDNRAYWKKMGQPLGLDKVRVPCFFYTGWFDFMCKGQVDNFDMMSHRTDDPELAASHRIVVGPWIHTTNYGASTDSNSGVRYGEVAFPPNSGYGNEMYQSMMAFYDRYLKGDMQADTGAPVRIYVMGENVWRDEQEWPLARTRYTPLYLDSGGDARSLYGNGRLTFERAFSSPHDKYDYNPLAPCDNTDNDIHKGMICDRRSKEKRQDVLVYTTAPLTEDLEITGNVSAKLFVQSSAVDTDFYVRLVDVLPDGRAHGYLSNVFRMRYRDGLYEPHYMTPGDVYPIDVAVGPISMLFRKGHAIRIEIYSSDFPENDRNLNTADPLGYGSAPVVARQTIWHSNSRPSHILLPVIPR